MIGRLARNLQRDDRGVAAIEFAIWTSLFFAAAMMVMDFAAFYMMRGRVNEALSAAATKSFTDRENINFSSLPSYVQNLSENSSMQVVASCNGVANSCTNLTRACACLKTNGSYSAASCGASCTGSGVTAGSTAGYYLTLSASGAYAPVFLPNSAIGGVDAAQSVTVRVQ